MHRLFQKAIFKNTISGTEFFQNWFSKKSSAPLWTRALLVAPVVMAFMLFPCSRAEMGKPSHDISSDEAVNYLCDYIKVNTTNPPGNERLGAEFLADILRKNGIEPTLYDTDKNRACVYARLKGNDKKRPILLLNHIDVVPARSEDWDQAPFDGKVIDGEIWGRGAIDMKGMAIAELVSLLALKRSAHLLDRDVIFLGTPDEEAGGTHGAQWFTQHHPELCKDAEYVINEGYFIETADDGKVKDWGVDISEKSVLWLKLTARGDAGHASMPMPDSAPNKLVRALARVVNAPPAPSIMPAVQEYFSQVSSTEAEPLRTYYRDIGKAVSDSASYAALLKDKLRSSMLRNTVSLTVIKAGYKTNVIPAEATAELDCRLLPGTDRDRFIAEIKDKIADPQIDVQILDWVRAEASAYNTELFDVIRAVAKLEQPGVAVVPVVVPWFTDSHCFRELGSTAYGFMPFRIDAVHLATMHGKNERIQVANFKDGVRILHEVIAKISGAR